MRQLYSVRKDRLGITFSPAKRASPSSKTWLMMWLWRALPNSLSPSSERMACPGGIIFVPGRPARVRMRSKGIRARYGRKRNRPPNFVRKRRGVRSSSRASATAAACGRTRRGRSSSRLLGSLAKPSSFKMTDTMEGLRESPSLARASAMSYTDKFRLRRATARLRARSVFGAAFGPLSGGRKNARKESLRNLEQSTRKPPGEYPKSAATSADGRSSTK